MWVYKDTGRHLGCALLETDWCIRHHTQAPIRCGVWSSIPWGVSSSLSFPSDVGIHTHLPTFIPHSLHNASCCGETRPDQLQKENPTSKEPTTKWSDLLPSPSPPSSPPSQPPLPSPPPPPSSPPNAKSPAPPPTASTSSWRAAPTNPSAKAASDP